MDVIHFTHGATDPLTSFDARPVLPPTRRGRGDSRFGCARPGPGPHRSPSLSSKNVGDFARAAIARSRLGHHGWSGES
jgi:hypothetical protein